MGGLYVVMPDLFNGDPRSLDPPPPGYDMNRDWRPKHTPEITKPIVDKVLEGIRKRLNPEYVVANGYCFGAKYVVLLLGEGKIDAGGIAHPSGITIDEVRKIQKPIIISGAEEDQAYPEQLRKETEKTLKEIGATYFTTLSSGVSHGFAVRGDLSKPAVKFAKEKCLEDFVRYFNFHSSKL
jgi:dienelactone hydrolase